jgi:molybdenum cofactor cytidylyltransferase
MTEASADPFLPVGAIVLAAGSSTRMARPKLLLPWGNTSILGHLIEQWGSLRVAHIAVVCARGDEGILSELRRLRFRMEDCIQNPTPQQGMFCSIQCAARWPGWKASLTHWAIILGDQPHLKKKTLLGLLDFSMARAGRVCQPQWRGRRRHPVLLPTAAFDKLARSDAADLKQFLLVYEVATCELDDPGLDVDIDSPQDYQKALAMAQAQE